MTMNQQRGGERVSGLIKDIHLEGLTRNGKKRQDDQFPIEFRTGSICNTNQTHYVCANPLSSRKDV